MSKVGTMGKLVVGIAVILALAALAVEVVAPRLAATAIEDHVRDRTTGVLGVSADVGPFPVVTRLLATDEVGRVTITLDEVAGQQLTFTWVALDLEGVRLDREALYGGDVLVRGIDRGRVTAAVDVNTLAEAIGVPVRVEGGTLVFEIAGADVPLPLAVEGRTLRLPPGLPTVVLPDAVPCAPTETAVRESRIELACTVERTPPILE